MSETLIEAARVIIGVIDDVGYPPWMGSAVDALRDAIEREEQRAWKLGDKVVVERTGICGEIVVCPSTVTVKLLASEAYPEGPINYTVTPKVIRRPTAEELENWPGGDE